MSYLFILDQCLFLVSTGDLETRASLDRRSGKTDESRQKLLWTATFDTKESEVAAQAASKKEGVAKSDIKNRKKSQKAT